jgi:GntR family transcriptional regulator, negative regulator for fad regulon and positive regulator of fabA
MASLPIDQAQKSLITAILNGDYPPGSTLPGERTLAGQLGVTRPTLREVLRRMETDGWLIIQQGKSTLVGDYLRDGGLNVLSDIVRYSPTLPTQFVSNLLQVRRDLAPSYTRLALENHPEPIIAHLCEHPQLDDTPHAYAAYDWQLHRALTLAANNPIYSLILNGFADFYVTLAEDYYFTLPQAREGSAQFYAGLLQFAQAGDAAAAADLAAQVMAMSIALWEASQ